MRRALPAAVTLLVVGALVIFLADSQTWDHVRGVARTGRDAAPGLRALAVVALAAGAALIAARGKAKRAVAVLTLLAGAGAVAVAVHAGGHTAWPWVAAVGGVLVAAAAVPGWHAAGSGGLSARYEAPGAPPPVKPETDAAIWGALDRGEDPTDGA